MVRIFCIFVFAILVSACGAKVIPLQASVSTIEVKIVNPQRGKQYQIHSTANEGTIDSKLPDSGGLISFDISGSKKDATKCFFVSDGQKPIPTKNSKTGFVNPIFNSYYSTKLKLDDLLYNQSREQSLLSKNLAYRGGVCQLLTVNDIPEKPSSACSPQEESTYGTQQCQNIADDNNIGQDIVASIKSGLCGLAIGAITNWFGGLLGGTACDLFFKSQDKNNSYKNCMSQAVSSCRSNYSNWTAAVDEIKRGPEKLQQECIQSKQNIQVLTASIDGLNRDLSGIQNSWALIDERHYCF